MLKKLVVIGLGYVGLPLAVEFGKSRSVTGFDKSKTRIRQLKDLKDATNECDPEQLRSAKHLTFTSSIEDIKDAQIYIVTVPTPIDKVNRPDLLPLRLQERLWERIAKWRYSNFESTGTGRYESCVPI